MKKSIHILAIADRPPQKGLQAFLAEHKIDLICTLGDLEFGEIRELKEITSVPKIGVYGNHCSGTYFEELGIKNMHLETLEFNGWTFGGFEGCVRYKPSPYAKMYSQEEATELLKNFPRVDALLTHCPPYGVNDDPEDRAHTGFNALRDYVFNQKPDYLLHGHTYPTPDKLVTQLDQTKIIYIFGEKIIELR